ncbi:hypothetical protein FJW06_10620 [Mesorhizobium sp. B4-1-3]|uniref:hypothetical protein n=1 Tax=Mesorhizobium sp. B4-1-3 TaxID=2589889 RepID=UPI00112CEE25|nr:hypothetical protein [Mesorhizobium sp. B4-1-3]TPI14421.1 hypothetical protein FJW06_10620 [Mesorhizobium sp. B4-1-3]
MMAPENRFTLFGIMLWSIVGRGLCPRQVDERACGHADESAQLGIVFSRDEKDRNSDTSTVLV